MIVLLKDGTVGEVEKAKEGDYVTVKLHDENGLPIQKTGEVKEILEED